MESLPQQFVSAMRTLFDIMDDKQTGFVKLTDIENRWRDDRTKGLPGGVIESLQKVASHDGLLTFDSFCTGLKICLLRNQVKKAPNKVDSMIDNIENNMHNQMRPPSAPLLDLDHRNWNNVRNSGSSSAQHRTHSMPQLMDEKNMQLTDVSQSKMSLSKHETVHRTVYGPPKPPRLEKSVTSRKDISRKSFEPQDARSDNERLEHAKIDFEEISRSLSAEDRGLGDGRSANIANGRKTSRRREPRRHTLHNGVDYNLIKRMKQIEQEKDILLQGLSAVEEAREWYIKQLAEVQDKMRYAGRMGGYVEPWNEAHQERLELLRARIFELNRQLGALATGWRNCPLSLHMNLALPATTNIKPTSGAPSNATVLRSQNRMLAEEVNRKNERISVLEREKSALIRELLLQRNRTKIEDNFN
ncbi:suppressor APC domain-containing protein 2 isoform X2 [Aricia agestis]|uniref:suppressor APC domain-containing protein 2 isoform X2 n=1 Tax=Aricia agestis TaxID=91739 RepID=UPI001C201DF1|nr:suppressor APC domain-containing protein 2 isoform X2 [Aricia agestis]